MLLFTMVYKCGVKHIDYFFGRRLVKFQSNYQRGRYSKLQSISVLFEYDAALFVNNQREALIEYNKNQLQALHIKLGLLGEDHVDFVNQEEDLKIDFAAQFTRFLQSVAKTVNQQLQRFLLDLECMDFEYSTLQPIPWKCLFDGLQNVSDVGLIFPWNAKKDLVSAAVQAVVDFVHHLKSLTISYQKKNYIAMPLLSIILRKFRLTIQYLHIRLRVGHTGKKHLVDYTMKLVQHYVMLQQNRHSVIVLPKLLELCLGGVSMVNLLYFCRLKLPNLEKVCIKLPYSPLDHYASLLKDYLNLLLTNSTKLHYIEIKIVNRKCLQLIHQLIAPDVLPRMLMQQKTDRQPSLVLNFNLSITGQVRCCTLDQIYIADAWCSLLKSLSVICKDYAVQVTMDPHNYRLFSLALSLKSADYNALGLQHSVSPITTLNGSH
ncbi:MAG: hypothetical protein NZ811_06245, partial [Gammaproteobacteria bacterium]|nr:hypothetical protein [Gammaproteobacteria bacterium]